MGGSDTRRARPQFVSFLRSVALRGRPFRSLGRRRPPSRSLAALLGGRTFAVYLRARVGLSQVPGEPLCGLAVNSDPGREDPALPLRPCPLLPSDYVTPLARPLSPFRGSTSRPAHSLSTLHAAGLPVRAQDSLPTCWLDFGRAGFSPAGLLSRVSGGHRFPPSSRAKLCLAHHVPEYAPVPGSSRSSTSTRSQMFFDGLRAELGYKGFESLPVDARSSGPATVETPALWRLRSSTARS